MINLFDYYKSVGVNLPTPNRFVTYPNGIVTPAYFAKPTITMTEGEITAIKGKLAKYPPATVQLHCAAFTTGKLFTPLIVSADGKKAHFGRSRILPREPELKGELANVVKYSTFATRATWLFDTLIRLGFTRPPMSVNIDNAKCDQVFPGLTKVYWGQDSTNRAAIAALVPSQLKGITGGDGGLFLVPPAGLENLLWLQMDAGALGYYTVSIDDAGVVSYPLTNIWGGVYAGSFSPGSGYNYGSSGTGSALTYSGGSFWPGDGSALDLELRAICKCSFTYNLTIAAVLAAADAPSSCYAWGREMNTTSLYVLGFDPATQLARYNFDNATGVLTPIDALLWLPTIASRYDVAAATAGVPVDPAIRAELAKPRAVMVRAINATYSELLSSTTVKDIADIIGESASSLSVSEGVTWGDVEKKVSKFKQVYGSTIDLGCAIVGDMTRSEGAITFTIAAASTVGIVAVHDDQGITLDDAIRTIESGAGVAVTYNFVNGYSSASLLAATGTASNFAALQKLAGLLTTSVTDTDAAKSAYDNFKRLMENLNPLKSLLSRDLTDRKVASDLVFGMLATSASDLFEVSRTAMVGPGGNLFKG